MRPLCYGIFGVGETGYIFQLLMLPPEDAFVFRLGELQLIDAADDAEAKPPSAFRPEASMLAADDASNLTLWH